MKTIFVNPLGKLDFDEIGDAYHTYVLIAAFRVLTNNYNQRRILYIVQYSFPKYDKLLKTHGKVTKLQLGICCTNDYAFHL